MKLSRRSVLGTAALAGAAIGLPIAANARQPRKIAIYDSRLPEARAFAAQRRHLGEAVLDIANADAQRWQDFRYLPAEVTALSGLTGWSDWLIVRGFLEEKGLRLKSETPVPAPISGKAHLFRWEMGSV